MKFQLSSIEFWTYRSSLVRGKLTFISLIRVVCLKYDVRDAKRAKETLQRTLLNDRAVSLIAMPEYFSVIM